MKHCYNDFAARQYAATEGDLIGYEMVANRELHNAGMYRDSGSWVVQDGCWRTFLLGNAVVAEH